MLYENPDRIAMPSHRKPIFWQPPFRRWSVRFEDMKMLSEENVMIFGYLPLCQECHLNLG